MKNTLTIPKLCKVGFNPRTDTYTGKLGYVIYNDGKVWRKEQSWNGWIYTVIDEETVKARKIESFNLSRKQAIQNYKDVQERAKTEGSNYTYYKNMLQNYPTEEEYLKACRVDKIENYHFSIGRTSSDPSIAPFEFDNEPIEGFVLNKKVGGYSSGWNQRQAHIRVYDPRGFEFEISPENLLYILEHTNSIVGKGLEGKFIYSWSGKDLVLLPVNAPEYQESIKYSTFVKQKVSSKELQVGGVYLNSKKQELVYLTKAYSYDYYGLQSEKEVYWFITKNGDHCSQVSSITSFKEFTGEVIEDTTEYFEKLISDRNHTPKTKFVSECIEASETNLKLHFGERSNSKISGLASNTSLFFKTSKGEYKQVINCKLKYQYGTYNNSEGSLYLFEVKDKTTKKVSKKTFKDIEKENDYFIKIKKQIS